MTEPVRQSWKALRKLIRSFLELTGSGVDIIHAFRVIPDAALELARAFIQFTDAVRIFLQTARQFRQTVYKRTCSVRELFCSVIHLRHTVCILLDAGRQFSGSIREFLRAVSCLINTVGKLTCAIREVSPVLLKVGDLLIHILEHAVVVLIQFFIVIEEAREDHCHAGAHLEVSGVHGDLNGIRNLQVADSVF